MGFQNRLARCCMFQPIFDPGGKPRQEKTRRKSNPRRVRQWVAGPEAAGSVQLGDHVLDAGAQLVERDQRVLQVGAQCGDLAVDQLGSRLRRAAPTT